MIRTTNAPVSTRRPPGSRTTGALTAAALATAALATTLAVCGPSAGPASALTTSAQTTTGSTAEHPRMNALCARIPRLITRTENTQARLNGDENTRGSVARLARRVEQAEKRGNADLADYLANRLEIRKQRAAIMPEQLELLHRAQAECDRAGS